MMMPPIPTDNLYKFYAMAGIAVVLFSVGFVVTKIPELRAQVFEAEVQLETLIVDTKELKELQSSKAADVSAQELRKLSRELRVKSAELEVRGKYLRQLLSDLTFFASILGLCALLGLALSSFGFTYWYNKVQCFNDALLKKEWESKNS